MERNQRSGSLIGRVRQQTERRALEQAKRVPWKRLAEAADEYTDWQVFTLWLRAVVAAAGSIPAMVAQEMESKTPRLLERIRPDVEAAVKNGDGPGTRIWKGCQPVGGDERLYRREAGRLVGCGPLLFFDVATLHEGVVTLGGHRPALARCPAATLSRLRTVAV